MVSEVELRPFRVSIFKQDKKEKRKRGFYCCKEIFIIKV